MIFLFEYANMTNNLVCGSSNKSEILVGYFTKFGDGGVDINPIGDLYKTQTLELAKYLGIPREIILKKPTAGLIKSQTDSSELKIGYKDLDKILAGLERKMTIEKISKLLDIDISEVTRIKNMRIKSQHKRRLFLIPKIGLRTPGLDWRSPVQLG
jgi:NAD+ synthase